MGDLCHRCKEPGTGGWEPRVGRWRCRSLVWVDKSLVRLDESLARLDENLTRHKQSVKFTIDESVTYRMLNVRQPHLVLHEQGVLIV